MNDNLFILCLDILLDSCLNILCYGQSPQMRTMLTLYSSQFGQCRHCPLTNFDYTIYIFELYMYTHIYVCSVLLI